MRNEVADEEILRELSTELGLEITAGVNLEMEMRIWWWGFRFRWQGMDIFEYFENNFVILVLQAGILL